MSMVHLAGLLAFAVMALGAVLVLVIERAGRPAQLRVARQFLIVAVVGVTLLAGLSRRDLWPYSSWSLMTGTPARVVGKDPPYLRLTVVAEDGDEYPVDYRAVEPFAVEELNAWMRRYFLRLPAAGRDSAAGYVLDRLNVARGRVRDGRAPGQQGRWLGPLRAPFHLLHPPRWTSPSSVPETPFVVLRLYGETWDLEQRALDSTRVERTLLYQYRVPAAP